MRRNIVIAVIVAQFAVLAFMAGEREWVLRTGAVMFLRTAPVDPRDPMRGDYVRFDYEISRVPKALCRDGVPAWFSGDWQKQRVVRDRRVYAEVELNEEGLVRVIALTDRKPPGRSFIRGRVTSVDDRHITVRYGTEAMFLQQGKGRELETSPKLTQGVPLNIEVAVSDGGLAVMKGYRWEPLGIALDLEWQDIPAAPPVSVARRVLVGITVELKNHGEKPVAIVARPEGGSFRLMPDERWAEARFRWVGESRRVPPATAETVKVLQPGEAYRERLDFTQPAWFLEATDKPAVPVAWAELTEIWNASFRIEYVPPTSAERATLPHAELMRTSGLRSRAFWANRGVD